jgi:hypothetical protein
MVAEKSCVRRSRGSSCRIERKQRDGKTEVERQGMYVAVFYQGACNVRWDRTAGITSTASTAAAAPASATPLHQQ